jgi:16S rRNA G966 N2-methylase RsmD
VYFAESSRKAAQLIRTNLESLGIKEEADVFERSAVELLRFLSDSEIRPTLIFLDPPYKSQGSYGQVLRVISQSNVLAEAGIVIAEHEKRFDPGEQEGSLKRYRKLNQGESSLSFYRMEANAREELSPSEQMLE